MLGPASPNLVPMTHANNANNANNATVTNATMESLSLCNYCCSPRIKMKKVEDPTQDPTQCPIKSKYEFGHATHYVYGVTTPRLLCDFETGTPP